MFVLLLDATRECWLGFSYCVCEVGCVRGKWESTVPPVGMCFSLQCVVVSHESGFSQDCGGNVPLSLEQDTHILPALCLYLETQTGSGH